MINIFVIILALIVFIHPIIKIIIINLLITTNLMLIITMSHDFYKTGISCSPDDYKQSNDNHKH